MVSAGIFQADSWHFVSALYIGTVWMLFVHLYSLILKEYFNTSDDAGNAIQMLFIFTIATFLCLFVIISLSMEVTSCSTYSQQAQTDAAYCLQLAKANIFDRSIIQSCISAEQTIDIANQPNALCAFLIGNQFGIYAVEFTFLSVFLIYSLICIHKCYVLWRKLDKWADKQTEIRNIVERTLLNSEESHA